MVFSVGSLLVRVHDHGLRPTDLGNETTFSILVHIVITPGLDTSPTVVHSGTDSASVRARIPPNLNIP